MWPSVFNPFKPLQLPVTFVSAPATLRASLPLSLSLFLGWLMPWAEWEPDLCRVPQQGSQEPGHCCCLESCSSSRGVTCQEVLEMQIPRYLSRKRSFGKTEARLSKKETCRMNLLKGLPIWKEEKIGEVAVVQSLALSTVSAQYVPAAPEFTPCCALLGPSGLCAAPAQVGMMLQTGESAPGLSRSTGAALCVLGQDRGQGSLWGCSLFCAHRWVEELWLLLSIYSATGVCRALWGFCHHHPRGERWEKFLFLSAAKGRDVPLWGWHEETELCSLPPSLVVGLIPCALRICSVYCVNQMERWSLRCLPGEVKLEMFHILLPSLLP